jgi:hypothetical protein
VHVGIDFESPSPYEIGLIGGILQWERVTIETDPNWDSEAIEQFDRHVLLVMHGLSKLDKLEADLSSGQTT